MFAFGAVAYEGTKKSREQPVSDKAATACCALGGVDVILEQRFVDVVMAQFRIDAG